MPWPCSGRRPSLPALVVYTLVALGCTGFLALTEFALYLGYILPNDAVLSWSSAQCVVNSSSIALQRRERCIAENECLGVYRASVRVRVLGEPPRELVAFDTVFGDFSHALRQPLRFTLAYNRTAPPSAEPSQPARRKRESKHPLPVPLVDGGIYTTACSVNPALAGANCTDPSAPVVSARLRAALHGGPCVGRVVLGSPAAYVTDFTARGIAAHRLVIVFALVLGSASLLFTYCACLGCALRRGDRRCANCLRPPCCRRACGRCCTCALPAEFLKELGGQRPAPGGLLTLATRSCTMPAASGGSERLGRSSWHSGDLTPPPSPPARPEQRAARASSSSGGASPPFVVSARLLLGADGARVADVGAATRALGRVGLQAARRPRALAEGENAATRRAPGVGGERAERSRDARVRRADGKVKAPAVFVVYSPSEAAAKGLVEVAAADQDGMPTALRLRQQKPPPGTRGTCGAAGLAALPATHRRARDGEHSSQARAPQPAPRRPLGGATPLV